MTALARALLGVVVWSAVAEFLLLRVFLRLGPALPAQDALLPIYRALETLGLLALNLAMLAAAALVAALAAGLTWRRPAEAFVGLALAAAVLVNVGLGVLLTVAPAPWAVVLQAGATIAALGAAIAGRALERGRAALALVAAAQLLALYHPVTQGAASLGMHLPGGGRPVFLAEALAVAAALALPWSFRVRPRRQELVPGLSLGLLFLAAHAARAWTVATLTMWTVSFTLFLPGALYAGALGVGAATILALRREPSTRPAAAGLLLVALAGLKLDFTYFALLGLAGLLVACQRTTTQGLASDVPQPARYLPAGVARRPDGATAGR